MNAIPVDLLIRRDLPAAREGDHAAYGRIVGACQNTITAIALSIVRDVQTSEDIAQDAFLSAWQHLRRLQNPDSFLPWLRQITRNLARDHLRAKSRAPHPVDDMEAAIQAAADPAPSPMHALIDAERQAAAATMLGASAGVGAKTVGQVLLGGLGGIFIGLFAAIASIHWGWRKQMREALDAEERRALTRSAIVNAMAIFGYLVSMLLTTTWTRGWVLATLSTCMFMGIVFWQTGVVQPRAKARRHALEAVQDPEGAARRRRRERLQCRLGLVFGSLGGFGGLLAGLIASGRIAF